MLEVWAYIAADNPVAADKVEYELYEAMEKLALNPHIGHKRDDLTDKPVRFWNVHSYTVIYNPDASPLMVLRIISNYRDIEALLND